MLLLHTPRGLVQLELARRDANPFVDLVIQDRDGVKIEIVDTLPYDPNPNPHTRGLDSR